MEPNNQTPNDPRKPLPPADRPTYEDFHAEGIDIVTDSGVSETNEFTMGETNSAAESVLDQIEKQEAVPQKPLTPDQATKIANLQEIPQKEIPVPKKPTPVFVPPPIRPQPTIASVMPPQPSFEQPKAPGVQNDPSIKQLRTFKSDAEEAVRYQNVSAIDIAVAEQKKREASTPIQYVHDEKTHANLGIFIIVVLAIIVLLLGGWYYWFSSSQGTTSNKTRPSESRVESIIQYGTLSELVVSERDDALSLAADELRSVKGIKNTSHLLLLKTDGVSAQTLPIADVMRDTDIPETLLRSLSGDYMIGTFISSSTHPFILLKSASFPNSFSGILEWESQMTRDLLPLIQIRHASETGLSTTTKTFKDTVAKNTDVRVTRNELGETILIYAFVNKDTIAIATSQEALDHVLGELLKVRTIQ